MANKGLRETLQLYVDEKIAILNDFPISDIANVVDEVWRAYEDGNTIYACGNGGNAAYCGNLVTDLANHPFVSDDKSVPMLEGVPRLRAMDLTSNGAIVTGIMNDLGPEYIFSQQLINDTVKRGDLIFGFTGSGNSGNILKAFEVGQQAGAKAIVITRGSGGKAKDLVDHCVIIPGTSTFPGQVGGNDNNFRLPHEHSTQNFLIFSQEEILT